MAILIFHSPAPWAKVAKPALVEDKFLKSTRIRSQIAAFSTAHCNRRARRALRPYRKPALPVEKQAALPERAVLRYPLKGASLFLTMIRGHSFTGSACCPTSECRRPTVPDRRPGSTAGSFLPAGRCRRTRDTCRWRWNRLR